MALMTEESPAVRPDILTSIDMSSLTQSELHSLSMLSNTSNPDTPFPFNLNPSLFNESASSRSQTFSDSPHNRRRRRGFSLLRRERSESNSIVNFLKRHLQLGEMDSERQRKRKRLVGEKTEIGESNVSMEIVNRNGEVVDLARLAKEERENEGGPFGGELRRRAAGFEREEELLAILAAMDGDWCSRRKKRRVVQSCLLGDALPVGWKLIIALRRKGGRFFPYCRRYISPKGEQLATCKEVSLYLQAYFGINDTNVLRDSKEDEQQQQQQQQQQRVDLEKPIEPEKDFPNSTIPNACVPIEPEKDVSILGIDNLPDVQVSDLYECHSCNVSFDVKDEYLQHLMSSHQRTTRKYRLGSSIGAGVIIRDGKYECQFCHKVFEEKRRYLGHVGNHVRGSARRSEVSTVQGTGIAMPSCKDQLPNNTSISRMDALIEIAQSSIQDISHSSVCNVDEVSLTENSRVMNADFKKEKSSSFCHNKNGRRKGKSLPEELYSCDRSIEICCTGPDETVMGKNNGVSNVSTEESNPPCDMLSVISMTDKDIVNGSSACLDKLEVREDNCKHRCSSEELNLQDKVKEISITNVNFICSGVRPEELDPHDKENDLERKEQSFTFDTTIDSATGSDLHAENTTSNGEGKYTTAENNRSTNETEGILGIHYPLDNEKTYITDSAGRMAGSICASERELEDANELAAVSVENHVSVYAMPQTSLNATSPFDEILEKESRNICGVDQNLESVMRPEYMKLNEVETQMFNDMTGEDFVSLSTVSMGFEHNSEVGLGLSASVGSQLEFPIDIACKSVTTTVCVWCGGEFCHQVNDIELQPDSVGFMCQTCRNKISKQFNDLETNFSLNHHYC